MWMYPMVLSVSGSTPGSGTFLFVAWPRLVLAGREKPDDAHGRQ